MLGVAAHDHPVDLRLQPHLLVLVVVDEPLGKTRAASAVLQQDEADLSGGRSTMLG